jgi:hypothetical protein
MTEMLLISLNVLSHGQNLYPVIFGDKGMDVTPEDVTS